MSGSSPLSFPVAPMKATLGRLPADDDDRWAHEIKWDGHRTLALVDAGRVRLASTSGGDSSQRWPEVLALAAGVNATSAILDGEMLVVDEHGRASFDLVQRRDPTKHVAVFHVFDVLSIGGTETISLPYSDRRRILGDLVEPGDHWLVPAHHEGAGSDLLAATVEQGLEGVVSKRLDSAYRPGTRSTEWRKIKNRVTTDVVVVGFTAGSGNRSGTFGALLVAVAEPDGSLRFAGGVGTGFDQATLESLTARLRSMTVDTHPVDVDLPRAVARTATWVRPDLLATIEIAEFTNDGHVRHASFVSVRERE